MVMPASKEERINIRIPTDMKLDAKIAAEVRRWTLSQLITDLLRVDIEAIKTANLEGFKDAAQRIRSAENLAKPQRIKTRRVAIQHAKGNEDERSSHPIPSNERRRAVGGGRKR